MKSTGSTSATPGRSWPVLLLLIFGAILRIWFLAGSTPNNAFDDHLQPIAYYVNNHSRPPVDACWECYQPPLYYVAAAVVYKAARFAGAPEMLRWKTVQSINTILSILNLLLILAILRRVFRGEWLLQTALLALAVVFPRDLYASCMITNDYALVFLTTLTIWLYLRYIDRQRTTDLLLMTLSAAACALTKQHGMIVLALPGFLLLRYLLSLKRGDPKVTVTGAAILTLGILLGLSEEIWKTATTHVFLLSNQHFSNGIPDQAPGSVHNTDFASLRIITLMRQPFLAPDTWNSFWTVVFGNAWFDYETRFVIPTLPRLADLPIALYGLGGLLLLVFAAGAVRKLVTRVRERKSFPHHLLIITFIGLCFFLVPLVQTLRWPYWSSMKAQFILPGTVVFLMVFGYALLAFGTSVRKPLITALTVLIIGIGGLHGLYVAYFLPRSMQEIHVPFAPYPQIP